MERILKSLAIGLMLSTSSMAWAQTDTTTQASTTETEAGDLLTQAELENLVAPIALYPDTLLIQVLVAATYPLQIVKANNFVDDNTGMEPAAMEEAVNAEGYDESVAVLATAFPDVLADMADNVDWTDSIGTAMLAQSDDVLNAVQTMRNQAINAGALLSGQEQTVSVDEGAVVIQPTDPQVVYVPQYNTETVYVQDSSSSNNDGLTNALLIFGTAILINEIFDNNNQWNSYWGCRNCAGWGGRPIHRVPPRGGIGRNGNINIGNEVNIGGGWKPEPKRQKEARGKIANKRGPDGATRMKTQKRDVRGDDMRKQLSRKSGAPDISRDRGARASVNRPSTRPGSSKKNAVARTGSRPSAGKAATRKPAAKPATRKPATRKPAARAPAKSNRSAMKQRAPAQKSRSASSRGRSGGGGRSRGRR